MRSCLRLHSARGGFALLAVLWVLLGISALGLAASLAARQAVQVARNRIDLTRAAWLAEGCLEHVRAVIAATLAERQADSDAVAVWSAADRAVTSSRSPELDRCDVALRPATTTIDVNRATTEQLRKLFVALGAPDVTADSLTDAVLDWLDVDDVERPSGAERSWYEARGWLSPRNGPLAHVNELRWIRGLEDLPALDTLLGVEPGRIYLPRAPAGVLASLPGVGEEAVLRMLEQRSQRQGVMNLVETIEQLSPRSRDAVLVRYAELATVTSTEPDAWLVTSRARVGSPPVTAVIELRLERAGSRAAVMRRRTWVE